MMKTEIKHNCKNCVHFVACKKALREEPLMDGELSNECPDWKHLYKVYICYPKLGYEGHSLVAADSAIEANAIVRETEGTSGYGKISEGDLVPMFSEKPGIVLQHIFYNRI